MTENYLNFINSEEFISIITKTDEEIADEKFCFLNKLFPLTYNETGNDPFVINIKELRESDKLKYAQSAILESLNLFLQFFRITELGTEKIFLRQLVKMKSQTVRILKSLMYHGLYTNANLFAFRMAKFRVFFRDLKDVRSIWEIEIGNAITEIEDSGYEYREPSISKNY